MKASIVQKENLDEETPIVSVQWKGSSPQIIEGIQSLLADESSVDVRVRCKDHQPLDGLGAHKLVLAAASPTFLKIALSDLRYGENGDSDQLLCIHLPDYTSAEVGPVMSLLYYGEVWLCDTYIGIYEKILEDLRIAVRISYNEEENTYSLVDRQNPIPDRDKGAKKNTSSPCNIQYSDVIKSSILYQDTNELTDNCSSHQNQFIKVKCEPQEYMSSSSYLSDLRYQTSQRNLKPIDRLPTENRKQFNDKSTSVSPILISSSSSRPSQIRIKPEFTSTIHNDLRSHNIDTSHNERISFHSVLGIEKPNLGTKRVKCKSESFEDQTTSRSSSIDNQCELRSVKAEPCLVVPGHQTISMKQEPIDNDYDINVDAASPMIILQNDNTSIAEEDLGHEKGITFEKSAADRKTFEDTTSENTENNSSPFSHVTNLFSRTDGYTDCSQSDISLDDASSTIGPEINVIACHEDPNSGCSYVTSSLSSYQAHRLTHQRKLLKQEAKELSRSSNTGNSQKAPQSIKIKQEIDEVARSNRDENESTKEYNEVDKRLFCDFPGCTYNTPSSSNLTQHLRVHNDEKIFECVTCARMFRSSSNLKVHIKSVHTKEKMFSCDHCEKRFATKWQKQSHTKTNHIRKKEASFDCTILGCGRTFLKYQSLAAHMKSGHKVQASNSQSDGPNDISITNMNDKSMKKPLQICESCGKTLKGGVKALQRHHRLAGCKVENVPELQCSICSKLVSSRSLKAHIEYHKKKEDAMNNSCCKGNLSCQVCQRTFTTEVSLQRHRLIHENLKPHVCSVCKKRFRQKGSLDSHFRVHTGVRWKCEAEDCGKLFITKSLLNQHIKASRVCRERLKR